MAPARGRRGHAALLLDSLEQRLDVLTSTLSAADIAEKSIDIVKEIKELHGILRSLRDEGGAEGPRKIVVVWGGPACAASGRKTRPAHAGRNTGKLPPENRPAAARLVDDGPSDDGASVDNRGD